jgi:hypothetical protein
VEGTLALGVLMKGNPPRNRLTRRGRAFCFSLSPPTSPRTFPSFRCSFGMPKYETLNKTSPASHQFSPRFSL